MWQAYLFLGERETITNKIGEIENVCRAINDTKPIIIYINVEHERI